MGRRDKENPAAGKQGTGATPPATSPGTAGESEQPVPAQSPSTKGWWNELPASVKWAVAICSTVFAFCAGVYSCYQTIKNQAQSAVTEEAFLGELAKRVRPTMVFDSKGNRIWESGTEDYISNLQVSFPPGGNTINVIVQAKMALNVPPLISGIDIGAFPTRWERVPPYGWKVTLRTAVTNPLTADNDSTINTTNTYQFKLEILH